MTIDEAGNLIEANEYQPVKDTSMNDLTVVTRPVLDEGNMSMIRTALAAIGNTLVDASHLAREMDDLRIEVKGLREETQRANHFREIADQAYQQVNAQRISAESELITARFERDSAKVDHSTAMFNIQNLIAQLSTANGRIAALEEDQSKLLGEMDKAIDDARTEANARVGAIEGRLNERIETLSEMVRDRDATIVDLRSRLDVSERSNTNLRQMLKEARIAFEASMGVLNGEMAAE
jgi:chromosome segregation ATPase